MRDSFLEEQTSSFGDNKTIIELKSRLFGDEESSKKRKAEGKKKSKFDLPEPDEEVIRGNVYVNSFFIVGCCLLAVGSP